MAVNGCYYLTLSCIYRNQIGAGIQGVYNQSITILSALSLFPYPEQISQNKRDRKRHHLLVYVHFISTSGPGHRQHIRVSLKNIRKSLFAV